MVKEPKSSLSSRSPKLRGQPSSFEVSGCQRMVSTSEDINLECGEMGPSRAGSIRCSEQHQAAEIYLVATSPLGGSNSPLGESN